LRQQSAEYIANGNQVETPLEDFQWGTSRRNVCYDQEVCEILQKTNRYVMGVRTDKYFGKHSLGVMFDCVMPTYQKRNAVYG
jgi:queuine/archaeosine tRNA-ribosyltransferase